MNPGRVIFSWFRKDRNRGSETWWVLQIHGEGYRLRLDDQVRNAGFYTTRVAEAQDLKRAISEALASVEAELANMLVHDAWANPKIKVLGTAKISRKRALKLPNEGFTFYFVE